MNKAFVMVVSPGLQTPDPLAFQRDLGRRAFNPQLEVPCMLKARFN